WDKSVGGHVDVKDFDTSRTAIREVLEELYQDEVKSESKAQRWLPSDKSMIYVGEWRPEQRGLEPFREIRDYDSEWCYFRLKDPYQYYSPRKLKDGMIRRLRVIVDVFLFISGSDLSEEALGELRNSKYKLITLSELKTTMDKTIRGEEIDGFDETKKIPEFAPDLINIMTGNLRDTMEEFSQYVKKYLKK
ncbi:MAG TPA: hypothetical protein VK469_14545, partial [Candidatus Kapabacteria bacterium]|nr:hypothetical protein [Candidatus Kapabacteria bacterium]